MVLNDFGAVKPLHVSGKQAPSKPVNARTVLENMIFIGKMPSTVGKKSGVKVLLRIQKSRQIKVMPLKVVPLWSSTDDEDDTELLSDFDHSISAKDDSGIDIQLNADVDPNYPDDADNFPNDPDNSNDNIRDSQETTDIDVKKGFLEIKAMMSSLFDKMKKA